MLAIAAWLVVSVAAAHADDPVRVYGERPEVQDPREVTGAFERIPVAEDPRTATTAGRLLDGGSGVRVQRSGSNGRRETIQLRGAGGHQVGVFLGEIRLNPAGGGSVDLSTLPIQCLDSADVLRGPSAVGYGSGAQGGMIRLNRQQSNSAPAMLSLSGGSYGWAAIGLCSQLGSGENRTLLGARLETSTGDFEYRDANGRDGTRSNNGHHRGGLLVNHHTPIGRAGTLELMLDGVIDQREEPGTAEFPTPFATSEEQRISASVAWADASWSAGTWRTRIASDATHRRYRFVDRSSAFGLTTISYGLLDTQVGLRGDLSYEGSSWQRPQLSLDARYAVADSGTDSEGMAAVPSRRSLALSANWTLFAGRSFRSIAGLRIDAADARDPVLLPRIGLVWSPWAPLALRANIGGTFRDPTFDELYFKGSGIAGDPDLDPEEGFAADVGLSWTSKTAVGLDFHLTGYLNQFDRLILFLPLDAFRIQASDQYGATVFGVESTAIARWNRHRLRIAHHWQRARFDGRSPAPLPHRPSHRVVARLITVWGPLEPHVGLTAQNAVTSDRFGLRSLPAYTLFDLGLRGRLPHGFSLKFEVENVGDHRGHFDSVHQPLPGRSFLASLEWAP